MIDNKKIIVLIPCRSGSKSIPNKNIKLFKNLPLFVHSILLAKSINIIDDIFVSTDSINYRDIAISYGANAPFLRPSELSLDDSSDYDVFKHFIDYYFNSFNSYPDIIIHLRPTYPLRTKELLIDTINTFYNNFNNYDSLRTIIPIDKSLFKMYTIQNNNLIPSFYNFNNIIEPHNQARQILPTTYLHNGCIDILKYQTIINLKSMTGKNIFPYIMDKYSIHDIDTIEDFKLAENI